jgi:serine/threonine protein kinase/Tfp pilus assembly protein PilF
VYKAYDKRLKRHIALKFISSELSHNEDAKNRFVREAQAASALDHPNICTVHEIDQTDDGQLFICMTLYEGDTVKAKIQNGHLPLKEVVNIALQIAQGLARAHEAGIFHRDLKPANIMFNEQGELKIVDFGLAKLSGQQDLTREDTTIGTVAYMSPEQAKGEPTDHRTDQWSFGVILYELVTGMLPFKGDYDQAIIYSVLNEEPDAIQNSNNDVPVELNTIVTRCLMKDPKDRYSSMDDIVLILDQYQQGITGTQQIYLPVPLNRILKKLKMYRFPLLGLVVFFFIIFGVWEIFFTISSPRYLVVLPFRIIGEEPIDDFYRDGILEIINSKLTQLEQFQDKLWIISGSEVRINNVMSVADARDLIGADLVITGSVGKREGSLRFTLDLVESESFIQLKSTDLTIDKNIASLTESKIIDSIVEMLNLELGQDQRTILYAGGTTLPDAHDYYVRGRGYLTRREESKNLETAISLFKRALLVDSTYLLVHTGLGEAYWRKYEKTKNPQYVELARISCRKAMRLGYQYAEVNITCGIIYRGIGEYERAMEMLNKALTIAPDNAIALLELGLVYLLDGKLELSRNTFETAIEKRPGFWQGHSYLGFYYYSTGEYEKAVDQYQKIIELIPHSDVGYKKLAAVYLQMDKSEEFMTAAEKAIQIKHSYSLLNNLAAYYYYAGQYSKSATMFKEVLAYNVHDYLIYGNLATASYYSNQKDTALVYYKKAIDLGEEMRIINPRDNLLLSNLAGYYVKLDSINIAYRILDQLKMTNPTSLTVIFNLGDIYEQLGERDTALIWMKKAIENGATLVKFKSNPGLRDLIADERFKKIIDDSGSKN